MLALDAAKVSPGTAYSAFEALRPEEVVGYSDFPVGPVCAYDVLSPADQSMILRGSAYSVVDPAHGTPPHDA